MQCDCDYINFSVADQRGTAAPDRPVGVWKLFDTQFSMQRKYKVSTLYLPSVTEITKKDWNHNIYY